MQAGNKNTMTRSAQRKMWIAVVGLMILLATGWFFTPIFSIIFFFQAPVRLAPSHEDADYISFLALGDQGTGNRKTGTNVA